jgi:TonB family protein
MLLERRAGAVAAALAFALCSGAAGLLSAEGPEGGAWDDRLYRGADADPPSISSSIVEGFDSEGFWTCELGSDLALATVRSLPSPERLAGEGGNDRVLGLKIEFLNRSAFSAMLVPRRPIQVDARCAMISLRVLGRNYGHELSVVVLDYYGKAYDLPLGRLDFSGWKTLHAYVPRFDPATQGGIVQDDRHYARPAGIRVAGIRLRFDPDDAYGSFYAYFDALGATVESSAPAAKPDDGLEPGAVPSPAGERPAEPPRVEAADAEARQAAASARILSSLKARIGSALVYPDAARRRGVEGVLSVAFAVDAGGALESARVERSSGSDILDRAGLDLLKSLFPVDNDSGRRLELRISIGYSLR